MPKRSRSKKPLKRRRRRAAPSRAKEEYPRIRAPKASVEGDVERGEDEEDLH